MEVEKPGHRRTTSRTRSSPRSGSPIRRLGEKGGSLWDGRYEGLSPYEDLATDAERVRVTIRVRPPTTGEAETNEEPVMDIDPDRGILVLHRDESTEFQFDAVLPSTATQADVYSVAAKPVVADVLNGYNGTVMAYGQTGAGKTYTLSSTQPGQLGIIPRASAEVFTMASADELHDYRVSMSYIQIYMEMIQDLLRPSSSNMQIRESENGVYISGVEEVEVRCVEDCLKLLSLGERNRAFAFTKLNAHSSRSHAIAVITVEKKRRKPSSPNPDEKQGRGRNTEGDDKKAPLPPVKEKILVGKLFLVDLAGSERLKKSGSEGVRANEAKSVNLSLTSLGKCINARADPLTTHVPFRDSKLTRLLQESLGGNAKTSLVINVAPTGHHVSESMSSLLFGSRAMKVKTKATVNVEEEYRQLTRNLQETIDMHDDRVHSLEVVVYSQEEQLAQAKARLHLQEDHLAQLQTEREEMASGHDQELTAREAAWEIRLEEVKSESRRAMEEAQHMHRVHLAQTVETMSAQRDSLTEKLRRTREHVTRLERRIKQLERNSEEDGQLDEEDFAQDQELQMEDAEDEMISGPAEDMEKFILREREERAAIAIQRVVRERRHQRVVTELATTFQSLGRERTEVSRLEVENAKLKAMKIAAAHQLIRDSVFHMSSAFSDLNRQFLTPRNML